MINLSPELELRCNNHFKIVEDLISQTKLMLHLVGSVSEKNPNTWIVGTYLWNYRKVTDNDFNEIEQMIASEKIKIPKTNEGFMDYRPIVFKQDVIKGTKLVNELDFYYCGNRLRGREWQRIESALEYLYSEVYEYKGKPDKNSVLNNDMITRDLLKVLDEYKFSYRRSDFSILDAYYS